MDTLSILLVEDDLLINRAWTLGLNQAGYQVVSARSLQVAERLLTERKFDATIVDVNLEDGSGLDLLRWLKASGIAITTLMVTARLDEETAIQALQRGATEFIRKPIGPLELTTRLDRMFRYANEEPVRGVHFKDLSLNESNQEVFCAGRALAFSPSEFTLFRLLLKNAGSPVSRETLLAALDLTEKAMDRTVDSHISRIRRKLRESAPGFSIESVWGTGYTLRFQGKEMG